MTPSERANVYEVKIGSSMYYGGYQLGWYWDRSDNDEPHGPFDSAATARRDAEREDRK
jgi:hypothetical protein